MQGAWAFSVCCFCGGTLHQQLPVHPVVLTTSPRSEATSNLFLRFFLFLPLFFFFFPSRSKTFLNSNRSLVNSLCANSMDVEVQTLWVASFLMNPLVPDKVFVTLEQGDISKMSFQQLLTSTPQPVPRMPVHTHPNFISIHQASQRCDKLHLNVESVEGLFLSAGSCQKPRHVTVPNARESQNHNLKTIYRWNVVILRWLGGENDCRSSCSSKLENHASSGTNKTSS